MRVYEIGYGTFLNELMVDGDVSVVTVLRKWGSSYSLFLSYEW